MRSTNPDKKVYRTALSVSVLFHAGLVYALMGMQFPQLQELQKNESIKLLKERSLKDRSIEVSFVQRSLAEVSLDNQEIVSSENESQIVPDSIEESALQTPMQTVLQSMTEEIIILNSDNELQAPVSIDATSIPIPGEAVISIARLQTSISNISSTNKRQMQTRWLTDCWQQQIEDSRIRCTNDPLLVTTPSETGQRIGENVFRSVNRADEQRQVTDRITRSNEVLSTLISDPLVGELASTRQSINRELNAYLNGNFNDTYWMFVQASQTADPQVGFLRYLGEPTCADGPCVFEYTDPRGNRNRDDADESKEGFSVKAPEFPFQIYPNMQDQSFQYFPLQYLPLQYLPLQHPPLQNESSQENPLLDESLK